MKKIISLFLVGTMTFSGAASLSSGAWFWSSSNTNIKPTLELPSESIPHAVSWQDKRVIDLTAEEVLSFLDAVKNQNVEVKEESGLLAKLGSSAFSNIFPYFCLYFAIFGLQKIISLYQQFSAKRNCGNIDTLNDPIKALELFDTYLSAIKGQTCAKEKMRNIVLSIVDENRKRQGFGANTKENGARVIYMVGPTGVGKSYSAEILTKVLTGINSKPYIVEASDIDTQSKSSPVEQLFGMRTKKVSNNETYECSPLITQIKSTPEMVVLINEYDKMHSPELDEKLRTIMDHGYINVNGEKIDCSKTIFIVTSNEDYSSVNYSGKNDNFDSTEDGTGSRTFVKHDPAFLNRIKLVEFENLSKEDYEEIAYVPFRSLVDSFKLNYDLDLDLKDTIKQVAEKIEKINKGARRVKEFADRLNNKILSELILKGIKGEQYKNKKYKVSYDINNDDFILVEAKNK